MNRVSIIVMLALIAVGAAVHGAVTQRWGAFAPDATRRERMHALVVPFPECESSPIEHDVPLKERSIATSRRYVGNRFAANTSIISGVPGAVATHTPDVCYTASGYTMTRAPKKQSISLPNGKTADFFVADFEKTKATQTDRVRVRWAWSVNGDWLAPDQPRFAFLRSPELFKLYIVTVVPTDGDDDSPAIQAFAAAAFQNYGEALAP